MSWSVGYILSMVMCARICVRLRVFIRGSVASVDVVSVDVDVSYRSRKSRVSNGHLAC